MAVIGSNLTLSFLTPSSTSQYNSANQLVKSGMTYDAAGNQTAPMSGIVLGYDAENRQVSYTVTGLSR